MYAHVVCGYCESCPQRDPNTGAVVPGNDRKERIKCEIKTAKEHYNFLLQLLGHHSERRA